MSFDNNFSQNEKFYDELIKRFFHRESYFYYCLQSSLNGEPGKKQFDKTTSDIVSKLIEFLINATDPIAEFKEISNAEKFNNFYENIKSKLSKIDLPGLDNKQTKYVIQDLALITLENFTQVFSKEDNRFVLQSYLDLKLRLKFLLDDSNGKSTNLTKKFLQAAETNSYLLDVEKADLIDQTSILAEVFIAGQQEEVVVFQKFFEDEIRLTLKPIAEADVEQISYPDFMKKCYDIFYKLIELGKFHNNLELAIISEKILQLIDAVKNKEQSEIQPAIELIFAANSAIEHFVFLHRSPQELDESLKKYDDFLLQLGIKEKEKNRVENEILEQVFEETIEKKDNALNPDTTSTFSNEAHLFFHVILNAIAKVDKKNDDSTYLEDIELASSSLKILTKKCELNKILILPELMESICINMKALGKHLPNTILEKIKEGVLLLKIFDQENADHESELLAILLSLKKYYSFTVKALEKNSFG